MSGPFERLAGLKQRYLQTIFPARARLMVYHIHSIYWSNWHGSIRLQDYKMPRFKHCPSF